MTRRYPPISAKFPHLLHGGDYNPDQWLDRPDIWKEDMRLMKLAGCNAVSVGIFCWGMYEPAEGQYEFDWLDRVMDMLADNGVNAILATPSGAKPSWMSRKYPEIRRVLIEGRRQPHMRRHNHCPTSPVYREKSVQLNTRLAQRYKNHPALAMWHVSNEYCGPPCHCDLCYDAFRQWLKKKYQTLEELNSKWYTSFWSHQYTAWDLIEPVDATLHGMMLDWARFFDEQMLDFYVTESQPLRQITPDVPLTVNMMGWYEHFNYAKWARHVDVISWDSYPDWHDSNHERVAPATALLHDFNRSLKNGQPFMLMESTPSVLNWKQVSPLKRPGANRLVSLQAVAHGSDSVLYFQWRKGRGGFEKFHGAVVDHVGHENTMEFRGVAQVGSALGKLDDVVGTSVPAEAAIICDWENRIAIREMRCANNKDKNYLPTIESHHRALWSKSVLVDIVWEEADLSKYKLVIAPMLYMLRGDLAERLTQFVRDGGTLVMTYMSGQVDEFDLCFLGGFPGPLREVLGIWSETTDALPSTTLQSIQMLDGNALGLRGSYASEHYAEIVHAESAKVLGTYGKEFYRGTPALTVNHFGKGKAYYMATRCGDDFLGSFYSALIEEVKPRRATQQDLPAGVSVQLRSDGQSDYLFVMNFNEAPVTVPLDGGEHADMLDGGSVAGRVVLEPFGVKVLKRRI